MNKQNFQSSANFAFFNKTLGLSPEFGNYLRHTIEGKHLEKKFIKECGTKVTLILTFCDLENFSKNYHDQLSRAPATSQRKQRKPVSDSLHGKKKAPSRIRRDRERFRAWIERRKQKPRNTSPVKNRTVSKEPHFVQCTPPSNATIRVCRPQSVTIGNFPTVTRPPEPDPIVIPVQSDSHPCICELCSQFEDVDPIRKYHQTCDNCGKPASNEQPLKPCARCLSLAYCGKECQTLAWKSKHKQECTKEIGAQVRAVKEAWISAREVWLRHRSEPFLCPST